jgi:hypothetical protein
LALPAKGRLVSRRGLKIVTADFGKRHFRIQNELPRHALCNFKGLQIDIAKQSIVHKPDERRDPRDFGLRLRRQGHVNAPPVGGARLFGQ